MCKVPQQDKRSEFCTSHNGSHARRVVHFALAAIGWLTYCRTLALFTSRLWQVAYIGGGAGGHFFHWTSSTHSRCTVEELAHLLARLGHVAWCPHLVEMGHSLHMTGYKEIYCFPLRDGSAPLHKQRTEFWSSGPTLVFATLCKEQNNPLSSNGDFSCFLGVVSQGRSVKLWHASGAYSVLQLSLFHPIQHKEGRTRVQV